MTQKAVLLTLDTIKSKKSGKCFDICYLYQDSKINVVLIPNDDEGQVGTKLDFVREGGRSCDVTISLQGTRVSYTDIKFTL